MIGGTIRSPSMGRPRELSSSWRVKPEVSHSVFSHIVHGAEAWLGGWIVMPLRWREVAAGVDFGAELHLMHGRNARLCRSIDLAVDAGPDHHSPISAALIGDVCCELAHHMTASVLMSHGASDLSTRS